MNIQATRTFHTEVSCNFCGSPWLWGLSWDGSGQKTFICPRCEKLIDNHDCKNGYEHGCETCLKLAELKGQI